MVTVTRARARQGDASMGPDATIGLDDTAHALPIEDETAGVTSQPVTAKFFPRYVSSLAPNSSRRLKAARLAQLGLNCG